MEYEYHCDPGSWLAWSSQKSPCLCPLIVNIKGVYYHTSLGKLFITSIPAALMRISHLVPSKGFCLGVHDCLAPCIPDPTTLASDVVELVQIFHWITFVPLRVFCPLLRLTFVSLCVFCLLLRLISRLSPSVCSRLSWGRIYMALLPCAFPMCPSFQSVSRLLKPC